MYIEHIDEEKLRNRLKRIVGKHLNLTTYKLFFFGSRVSGNHFKRSDIDLGIEGPKPIGVLRKMAIEDDLDKLPILYKIDIVDFTDTDKSFRKIAGKHKEYIN